MAQFELEKYLDIALAIVGLSSFVFIIIITIYQNIIYDKDHRRQEESLVNLKINDKLNYCPNIIRKVLLEMNETDLEYYRKLKPRINVIGDIVDLIDMEMQHGESGWFNNADNMFETNENKTESIDLDSIDWRSEIIIKGDLHLNENSTFLFTLKNCEIAKITKYKNCKQ